MLLAAGTLILLAAGAMVTSTGSSLAVPDWPLAYGELFPPMVGGIFYEHGHRLVAATVGLVTLMLAGWLAWAEERRWVKWMGLGAAVLVVVQGVLGGLTVIYLLPEPISISHAVTAQLFFLLVVIIGQVTHPGWAVWKTDIRETAPRGVRLWGIVTLMLILLELLAGATMRHNSAGLAIPDWPLAYGSLLPPLSSFPLIIHFVHRILALLVLVAVGGTLWVTLRGHRGVSLLVRPAAAMGVLLVIQGLLGGGAILTRLSVLFTTLHVVNGALLLGAAGILIARAYRLEWGGDRGGS
jgi:cytochrome c oxidase assembly protein subunit 15